VRSLASDGEGSPVKSDHGWSGQFWAMGAGLGALLTLTAGCESTPIHTVNEKYQKVLEDRWSNYRIKPGDTVDLNFYNLVPELNQKLFVLPDGRTDPFFMDNAEVAGKTVKELEELIHKYYVEQVRSTEVSVSITPAAENIILEGEVLRPLPQPYTLKMTLMQALGHAGGYKLTACLHTVIVRRPYLDALHPDVFRINLRDYADVKEELFLLPSDHIIVEKNLAILVRDYINDYVWGFLPPFLRSGSALVAAAL
jgi:hypothetical protein